MAKGIVKWFDDTKGYGFVTLSDSGEEVFVHFSAIHMEGRRSLSPGQRVSFEVVRGPKGLQASRVRPLEARPRRGKRRAEPVD